MLIFFGITLIAVVFMEANTCLPEVSCKSLAEEEVIRQIRGILPSNSIRARGLR